MTTCSLIFQEESSQTGKRQRSSNTSSSPALYLVSTTALVEPETPASSIPLEDFLNEFADDQEVQRSLTQNRKALAKSLYADEPDTFTYLRLSAGLSQQALADRAGTTQSYVARIEKGIADPSTAMIVRLAQALGIDDVSAFSAIRNQRATRGAR